MKHNIQIKNKYQTALRRYLIDQQPSRQYASVFGLPISTFREWISAGTNKKLNWDTFGKEWHLETILPFDYFNSASANEVNLCYHFSNIRLVWESEYQRPSLMAISQYFQELSAYLPLPQIAQLIAKTEEIKQQEATELTRMITFASLQKKKFIEIALLGEELTDRANRGESIPDLLMEKQLWKRFAPAD